MIRVLVVDPSPTVRQLVEAILHSDAEIRVIGTAVDGGEAVRKTLALKPDLVTMDIRMPVMDGLEATRQIMAVHPTPIVVVSARVDDPDLQIAFNAIRAGALDVIEKPAGSGHADYERIRERLVSTVKLMAEVKVIGRHRPRRQASGQAPELRAVRSREPVALITIGSSTGGPAALKTLLSALPLAFPIPIVIVQHIAVGFLEGLIGWLQQDSQLRLQIARHNQRLHPGEVYFAPPEYHLEVMRPGVLGLNQAPAVSHVRPSATVLFESAAHVYGAQAAGIVLTGMGDDGAAGLKAIHDRGGITLAQDEATSVIYGMPKVAVELGGVEQVLPIHHIAPALLELVRTRR